MNNYEKIKAMSIDEMAEHLVWLQLNVMAQIQKTLVHCLPLPNETQQEQMYKDTLEALKSEAE